MSDFQKQRIERNIKKELKEVLIWMYNIIKVYL